MIVIFHALLLVSRYLYYVVSQSVIISSSQDEKPLQKIKRNNVCTVNRRNAGVISDADFRNGTLRFFPPAYVQRYLSVQNVLQDERWKHNIKKIVDFGCAEFGFFPYMKNLTGLQEIFTVDIDRNILQQYYFRVVPLNSDYLDGTRQEPLTVNVLAGSIADSDDCLLGCDAVICIELIEHLYPDTLEDVPYTVFGFIKPLIAIFTTPNSEFNVLFNNFNVFRHHDHKFEWDRAQFECWANNIVTRYPDYKVCFQDIGPGPAGTEHLGSCSQMALFIRRVEQTCNGLTVEQQFSSSTTELSHSKYSLVHRASYPFKVDSRNLQEKICEEAEYYLRYFSSAEQFVFEDQAVVPLSKLLQYVLKWTDSISTLRKILEDAGWQTIEREPGSVSVVYPLVEETTESESDHSDFYCNPEYVAVEENWDVTP